MYKEKGGERRKRKRVMHKKRRGKEELGRELYIRKEGQKRKRKRKKVMLKKEREKKKNKESDA